MFNKLLIRGHHPSFSELLQGDFLRRVIDLSAFVMKVAKVFEFLGVHEDIGEEHLLLRLFIQKRVIHSAYGHFRTEVAQELHSLKNKLVVVAQGTRFHQTTKEVKRYTITRNGTSHRQGIKSNRLKH